MAVPQLRGNVFCLNMLNCQYLDILLGSTERASKWDETKYESKSSDQGVNFLKEKRVDGIKDVIKTVSLSKNDNVGWGKGEVVGRGGGGVYNREEGKANHR